MQNHIFIATILIFLAACNQPKNEKSSLKTNRSDNVGFTISDSTGYTEKDSVKDVGIKGYLSKLFEGKHKYGGYTKVSYMNTLQLLTNARKTSIKEMWNSEKLESKIINYKNYCRGGQLRIDIGRPTIGAANTEMFTIIIKDSADIEIFRQDLDSNIPETPSADDNWWNIEIINLEKKIRPPFNVYVVDRLQDYPFKFLISAKK